MNKRKIKHTFENRALFSKHLNKWQDRLNLRNWNVTLSDKFAPTGCAANIVFLREAREAKVALSKYDEGDDLENSALHELLHLLLVEYQSAIYLDLDLMGSDYYDGNHLRTVEHDLIKILEKLLLSDGK